MYTCVSSSDLDVLILTLFACVSPLSRMYPWRRNCQQTCFSLISPLVMDRSITSKLSRKALPQSSLHWVIWRCERERERERERKRERDGAGTTLFWNPFVQHPQTGELHDLKVVVSKTQNLEIYDPVQVSPKQIVLLWDPQVDHSYQHGLEATGGSGKFQWSCDPEDVVGVSNYGAVVAIKKGRSLVTAADKRNTAHFDTAEVGDSGCLTCSIQCWSSSFMKLETRSLRVLSLLPRQRSPWL